MSALNPFRFPPSPQPVEVSPLTGADHATLARQIEGAAYRHIHLDWQSLPEMLRSADFYCEAARESGRISAAVGASLHMSPYRAGHVSWLRLLLASDSPRRDDALDMAWQSLRADLLAHEISHIGMLAIDPWIEAPGQRWGFAQTNSVITLRRSGGPLPEPPKPPLAVREVKLADLDAIAELDAMAFDPIWHHNRATLESAARQAATFTVLEDGQRLLGYQLSTWHLDTGHLARLAIRPDMQGQGLGAILAGEMFRFFLERSIHLITVNTQADNLTSQNLYKRLGFEASGHRVAYWSIDLS